MPWWRLETFDRYFRQIDIISQKCDKVYIIYLNGEVNEKWMNKKIEFIKVNMRNFLSYRFSQYINPNYVYEQIKDIDVDLYFSFSRASFQLYINYFSKMSGKPYVISMTGDDIAYRILTSRNLLLNMYLSYLNKQTFIDADLIIPIAEKQISILESYGVEKEKIYEPIYNGIDADVFRPLNLNKEFTVGYAGRLSKEKGVYFLLELMNKLKDVKFIVAGYNQVNVKFPDNCEYLGNIDYLEMPDKFYNRCSIIVLPSLKSPKNHATEGFPNVLLESYACEKTVICSPDAFPSELKLYGFIIPLDIYEWVYTIKRLKWFIYELLDLGIESRRYVIDNCRWEDTGNNFYEAFKAVLK